MAIDTATSDSRRAAVGVRFTAWPLWAALAGLLGFVSTVLTDKRAGEPDNMDYTVTVADMAPLDHELFRIGGFTGYLAVACLIVFVAVWRRNVEQRFGWSTGAKVVGIGVGVSAAALTLAYGWKAALGNYLHGAMEEGVYDDAGLYVYYVMNDFSPYIGWYGVLVAGGALAWMAFRERLVSRVLGGASAVVSVGTLVAVGATGVPGLPVTASLGLMVAGVWLALGRSPIVTDDDAA